MLIAPEPQGFALLPWLTAEQAVELALTGVAVAEVLTRSATGGHRWIPAVSLAAAGAALALGRWPPGGPRLLWWLARL